MFVLNWDIGIKKHFQSEINYPANNLVYQKNKDAFLSCLTFLFEILSSFSFLTKNHLTLKNIKTGHHKTHHHPLTTKRAMCNFIFITIFTLSLCFSLFNTKTHHHHVDTTLGWILYTSFFITKVHFVLWHWSLCFIFSFWNICTPLSKTHIYINYNIHGIN